MRKIMVLLFFIVIILSGCANKLNAPDNIKYEDGRLSWNEVKGITSYRIIIGDSIYYTEKPDYNLDFLGDGSYEIYICAIKNNKESPYSEKLTIAINRSLPLNMRIDGEYLLWDDMDSVTSYLLYIDGVEIVETEFSQVKLSELELEDNKIYAFHLKVISKHNFSAFSDTFYYHTYVKSQTLTPVEMKLSDQAALSIEFPDEAVLCILSENQKINDYVFSDRQLEIGYSVFRDNPPGEYQYLIFAADCLYKLKVKVINANKPYIISNTAIEYKSGEDIILLVELAGGNFDGLFGNDIGDDNYQFIDSTIIIYNSYIERLITAKPDRKTIILIYGFKKDNQNIRGDIIITLNKK
ncbi:MAG: hypothetical protein M0R05_01895 [Bacilli bacterium]|nr:hypothetical protein [Bacilli bacterium]